MARNTSDKSIVNCTPTRVDLRLISQWACDQGQHFTSDRYPKCDGVAAWRLTIATLSGGIHKVEPSEQKCRRSPLPFRIRFANMKLPTAAASCQLSSDKAGSTKKKSLRGPAATRRLAKIEKHLKGELFRNEGSSFGLCGYMIGLLLAVNTVNKKVPNLMNGELTNGT